MKRVFALLIIVVFAFLCATDVFALSTSNVPPSSYIYRDVEKLVALGYAQPTILGQRPWARSEVARLVAQALKVRAEKSTDFQDKTYFEVARELRLRHSVSRIIDRLAREFHEELVEIGAAPGEKHVFRIHPLEKVDFLAVGMSSAPTVIPANNGVGTINAVVNPLGDYREGRWAIDGLQAAVETTHRFGLTKYFSIFLKPRFEISVARGGDNENASALVQNAYAVFEIKNFSLEFGRDSLVWGLGQHGGTMLTDNPRPLDMIKITNPHPARLPWVFKHLGEWRYTVFGANLGPQYVRKWAWLMGWKLTLMPSRWVELGIGHLAFIGGEGAQPPSAADVISEFFGFRLGAYSGRNVANQMFDFGILVRIPPARGMQVYGMLSNEDKRDSIKRFFEDGSSYLAGVYLPALGARGALALRAEYTRTCALCFRHSTFADGATLNRKLLGTDLGPDAQGVHTEASYDVSDDIGLSMMVDWDHRGSDLKMIEREPDGSMGDVVTVQRRPAEDRYRAVLGSRIRLSKMTTLYGALGYERVINHQYIQGNDRNNFKAALSLSVDLDSHFRYLGD